MSRSDYLWFFSSKGINSSIENNVRFLLPQLQSQHVDNRPRTGERLIDGVALQLHKQVWCYVRGRTARKRINNQQTVLVIIFNHKVFGCVWLFHGVHIVPHLIPRTVRLFTNECSLLYFMDV